MMVRLTLGGQRFIFTGASCGSISAAMAACNIDITDSMKIAHSLVERETSESLDGLGSMLFFARKSKLRRPWLALPFKWRMLVKEWLEVLLPSNAHVLCSGRLYVQCQQVFPRPRMEVISEFSSKPDLISVLLASCHIPFFMDSKFSANIRGKNYIDGAIWRPRDTISVEGLDPHITLDPQDDPDILMKDNSSMVYKGMESITRMMEKGKKYILQYERARDYLNPAYRCEIALQQQRFLDPKPKEGCESELEAEQEEFELFSSLHVTQL